MSSLFAYAGKYPCIDTLMNAMSNMSAQRFELCGIALKDDEKTQVVRVNGGVNELKVSAKDLKSGACIGLGELKRVHRVKPSGITAPPAVNEDFICALDGKIKDFDSLCSSVDKTFPIATDEDLLLSLLLNFKDREEFYLLSSVGEIIGGSSFAFVTKDEDAVFARAGERPLYVGISDTGRCVSSEVFALFSCAQKYFELRPGECVKITAEKILLKDTKMRKIKRAQLSFPSLNPQMLESNINAPSRAAYETVRLAVSKENISFSLHKMKKRTLAQLDRIIICAADEEYRAAMLSADFIEAYSDIPCSAKEAAELLNSGTVFDKRTLLLAVSSGGEDKDVLACVKRAKSFDAHTIGICRAGVTALGALCEDKIEIPFCTSPLCRYISCGLRLNLFSLWLGNKNAVISDMYLSLASKFAELLPGKISAAMKINPSAEKAAHLIESKDKIFICGEGADFALSFQSAEMIRDKLEINAAAISSSSLCSLNPKVLSGALVIVFLTNKDALFDVLSCARRCISLGAEALIFTTANIENEISGFDNIISVADSLFAFDGFTALCAFDMTLDSAVKENEEENIALNEENYPA